MHQLEAGLHDHEFNSEHLISGRLVRLRAAVEDFLGRHTHSSIVGAEMAAILERHDGANDSPLDRLLEACGFAEDASGFLAELMALLESGGVSDWRSVKVNGVTMPHPLLLAVLESIEPGDRLIDISSVEQLEDLIRRPVPPAERDALQEVLDRFPVRLSQHSLRQLRLSNAVGCQYLPFVDELSREGQVHTWVGQFHSGVIERMYRNRVIMVLNMSCPVYCRFCFRKHKECRQEPAPTRRDVLSGVGYVRSRPEITEVVLTGGDPFMNRSTLTAAVEGLLEVDHVQTLRLATRSLSYHPALFTQRNGYWMRYLKKARAEADRRGKRIEIATHFIHPDELSLRSIDLIAELVSSGIPVYVQTPLLGGTNHSGSELVELYQRLRAAGAEMHYVFMPCSPLQGNRAYRSTIDDGMRLAAHLRANLSDRAMPHFCTATAFGKIDWGVNGWAVDIDPDDDRFLWLRTPYTEQTFAQFAPDVDLSAVARRNAGGTLDARFMVEVGDRRWLRGSRVMSPGPLPASPPEAPALGTELARFGKTWRMSVAGGESALRRVSRTRVELDCFSVHAGDARSLADLAQWTRVSDVVIFSSGPDPLHRPGLLRRMIEDLAVLPRITSIRVRSHDAVAAPERVTNRELDVLASANRLGATAPLRVELELPVLHASQLTSRHGDLANRLRMHGVTTYANTLLVAGINADPDTVRGISSACRRHGIEFHHLVVAGHPAQQAWNESRPIAISQIIDIASELRRTGSGRELPRYVVQTALGEVDLGLTAEPIGSDADGHILLRLLPFKVDASGEIDPWGTLPEGTGVDRDRHPIVPVTGLTG